MTEAEDKAWENVAKAAYGETDTNLVYTNWAKVYDDDVDALGYSTPENVSKEIMNYINNSPTSQILDVGAGTGRCGEVLKKHGYVGIIDALEINEAMLDIARSKQLYRGHFQIGLFPDQDIPLMYGLYDGIISAGTFGTRLVEAESVVPFVRALKSGGYAVWSTRDTDREKEYRDRLKRKLRELVDSEEIERVEIKPMQHFAANCKETGDKIMAIVYVYRKL